MNTIASVLAGQGVLRVLEVFWDMSPLVCGCVAGLSTLFVSIGLFVWRNK